MSITSWVNNVLPRTPGAMKALVEQEAVLVVNDFCRESTAWRDMQYGFNITAGDREVPIVIDDSSQALVAGILRVYYDNRQLTPYSHAPFETTSSYPSGYTTKPEHPDVVYLATIPTTSQANKLDAYVYLKPTDATAYLPGLLTDDYWEYIFDGILARMYQQPEKPYTDTGLAAYHARRYLHGKNIAKDKASRGFTGNAQNWTFPSFGR